MQLQIVVKKAIIYFLYDFNWLLLFKRRVLKTLDLIEKLFCFGFSSHLKPHMYSTFQILFLHKDPLLFLVVSLWKLVKQFSMKFALSSIVTKKKLND